MLKVTERNQVGSKEQEQGQDALLAMEEGGAEVPWSWPFTQCMRRSQPRIRLVNGKGRPSPRAKRPSCSWFRDTPVGKGAESLEDGRNLV